MRSIRLLALLLLVLFCCCARQVVVRDISQPDEAACAAFFPTGAWHMVHTIEADLPFGKKASIIGVTFGDSASRRLRVTGLSIEGMTLFDVLSLGNEVRILSALPPMDNPAFLEVLLQDIRFLFFQPDSNPVNCTWVDDRGKTELALQTDGTWTMTQTNADGHLVRKATAKGLDGEAFAKQVTLEAFYPVSYSLRLSLFESGPEDPSGDPFSP